MKVDSPVRRLPAGMLSLLPAALSAAVIAIPLSSSDIAMEQRSAADRTIAPTIAVSAVAISRGLSETEPDRTDTSTKATQRKTLFLYLLSGLPEHPLGIFK